MEALKKLLTTATPADPNGSYKGMRVLAQRVGEPAFINIGGEVAHDPASLTKLMTLYCILKAPDTLPATITISKYAGDKKRIADHTPNYKALQIGDSLPFTTAVQATITASDNVTAAALGEALGEGKSPLERHRNFVGRMNDTAAALGMNRTRFVNASGLPADAKLDLTTEKATTTATDMATLLTALYREFPQAAQHHLESPSIQYGRLKEPRKTFHKLDDLNTPTSLLDIDGLHTGAKTGFTSSAWYNIATMATDDAGNQLAGSFSVRAAPPPRRQKHWSAISSSRRKH
jgi:D-alanyl-D-alanine carboxypeptidase